jgi:hypothetical protein
MLPLQLPAKKPLLNSCSAAALLPCVAMLHAHCLHAGELQEPSKRTVARVIEAQDQLVEQEKEGMGDGDAGP